MNKFFYYVGVVVIGIGILLTLYSYYLRFEPFTPPTAVTPLHILNTELKNGDNLSYELDYCVYKKVPTTNSRRIVQLESPGRVYFLATTSNAGSTPSCNKLVVSFPLPSGMEPGHYKVISTGSYQVNSLKTETKDFETEAFEIK